MGHLAEEEYLVKENIDEYLDALALRINETGIGKHRILVVGEQQWRSNIMTEDPPLI